MNDEQRADLIEQLTQLVAKLEAGEPFDSIKRPSISNVPTPGTVTEEDVAALLVKQSPEATGRPEAALKMPGFNEDEENRWGVVEKEAPVMVGLDADHAIQKKASTIVSNKLKADTRRGGYWCPAHFHRAHLSGKKGAETHFEVVCDPCHWKIYYGDASILPVSVQESFSWVIKGKRMIWIRLLCLGHAIRHLFGFQKVG